MCAFKRGQSVLAHTQTQTYTYTHGTSMPRCQTGFMLIHVRVEHGGGRRGRRVERARALAAIFWENHTQVCVCVRAI